MRIGEVPGLLKETFKAWSGDKAPRMGAALSYYTIFSLAPLLVVVIAVAGLFFGEDAARGRLVAQLSGLIGREGAQLVETMVQKASEPRAGILATVIGLVTLVLGATGVLMELHDALNTIWKVVAPAGRGVVGTLRDRLLSFGVVLAFGFLLLVSLVLSAGLAAMGSRLSAMIPGWVVLAYVLNYGLSILLVTLLMGTLFVLLPDVRIAWRDVWVGSFVTAVLFHLGKLLIGLYLGKAAVGSPFGAAGALAVLLVWIYYTSQVFLFGAEFTQVYTRRSGRPVVPKHGAVPAPGAQLAAAQPPGAEAASGRVARSSGQMTPAQKR
jgi:membrane protein